MSDTMDDLLDCRERLRKVENDRDLKAALADRYAEDVDAAEARVEALTRALGAYRSALRSGEPESDQLRAFGDAALSSVDATRPTGDKE